ncbi:MAG: DUF3459 domain-containing protein, partial [Chloroflexia bacterium]|nr:DUF3459 domain-containing protein [Chloroflexia bacterium]
ERLRHLVDPAAADAAAALLLLAPETPLLWMGEEFAASAPFLYFTDHEPDLGKLVTEGRTREFAGLGGKPGHSIPDPQAEATFRASKLDLAERETHAGTYRLYRDLLALRRDDPVLRDQDRTRLRATAVGERIVAVHRWRGKEHRLLLANLGDAAVIELGEPSPPSPLSLARERGSLPASADNSTANRGNDQSVAEWTLRFSTADRRYDGSAEPVRLEREDAGWRVRLPARTAVLLGGTAV